MAPHTMETTVMAKPVPSSGDRYRRLASTVDIFTGVCPITKSWLIESWKSALNEAFASNSCHKRGTREEHGEHERKPSTVDCSQAISSETIDHDSHTMSRTMFSTTNPARMNGGENSLGRSSKKTPIQTFARAFWLQNLHTMRTRK